MIVAAKDRQLVRYCALVCLVGAGLMLGGRAAGLTSAADLCALEDDPCVVSTVVAVDDGSSIEFLNRSLVIAAGGRLDAATGAMSIGARTVTVEEGAEIRANGSPQAVAGEIVISANEITIAGEVSADGSNGGDVSMGATTTLSITGTISANGTTGTGFGGDIELTAGTLIITGELFAAGSSAGLGGCILGSAVGDVTVLGTLRAGGGDGGEISLVAGQTGAGGNLQLSTATTLLANGTAAEGGSGGDIELSADGDGTTSGLVTIAGSVEARGQGGGRGGDGGSITVTAAGDLIGLPSGETFDVSGGSPDGLAGEITLSAGRSVQLDNQLRAQGSGREGAGGDISIRAAIDLQLEENARVRVGGADDGGSIGLMVQQGELIVRAGSSVEASGTLSGDGGDITCEAIGDNASVIINGTVIANGASPSVSPVTGGIIDIDAGNFVTVGGPAETSGGQVAAASAGGGAGGSITITTRRGPVRLEGRVLAPGVGTNSLGGALEVVSGDTLTVDGVLDTGGQQEGGHVALSAARATSIAGRIMADGRRAESTGGLIELTTAADLAVSGSLIADGGDDAGAQAGRIVADGCSIDIQSDAELSAMGPGGRTRIIGHEAIVIGGDIVADSASGMNQLVYRVAAEPPLILATAMIVPDPMQLVDATLSACPVCGDGSVDPPETCDDENTIDGDGCSSTCQVEPAGLCDVNGDAEVNVQDIDDLVTELFDGDGDRVVDVAGGSFPGQPGADANEDGRITAADLSFCLAALSPEKRKV